MSPSVNELEFSVVIVNYNRCEDLRAALASVYAQEVQPPEVIVVDNASTDGSRAMLACEYPAVQVIALDENLGMAGYTVGFERARGELVFQMDNDSLMPEPTVLTQVRERFGESDARVAVVAARVEEYHTGDDLERVRARDTRHGPLYTGGFHSGGVAFRRNVLAQLGGYNRDVFLYGSELFLQMRFLAAQYGLAFYPEILMLHKSSGTARSTQGLYYELRNRYWFMRCFATREQQWRYLPTMLLHDVVYAFGKGKPTVLARAWRDGFGVLPPTLSRLLSNEPEFVAKVEEIGSDFGFRALSARVRANLREGSARE